MENKGGAMSRAIAGELHKIIAERTGIDTRGMVDPSTAYLIDTIRKRARERGFKHAERLLDEAERKMIIHQQSGMMRMLQEDLSRLALTTGNADELMKLDDLLGPDLRDREEEEADPPDQEEEDPDE